MTVSTVYRRAGLPLINNDFVGQVVAGSAGNWLAARIEIAIMAAIDVEFVCVTFKAGLANGKRCAVEGGALMVSEMVVDVLIWVTVLATARPIGSAPL